MFDKDLLPMIYQMNTTVMWIAVTVGILLYIIGFFAGGRMTKGRILLCTLTVTTIAILGLRVPMLVFGVIKDQYHLVTLPEAEIEKYQAKKNLKGAAQKPAGTAAQSESASNGSEEVTEIPLSFQVLSLVLYTAWVAFLVGMGIFFYETLIVTAEEIDKK
ncbi:MAG: hypothetical protein ONB48_13600 [candidate division KSB1 bacterium]|nr:hypothetical protein [candidate division KSB1 bacterium]MDZ7274864.1 hypothetical protein [candidate division KSB1 bacterium]MDZ7286684.1 hypothetical protein [candidate division KSB1 bacterium]MDZ7299153.1 hypothetical protein [candidate division KSB1 bacterium]MDZ7307037.1 hypothetical protein [candidate division KSB1 bacterium]